MYKDKFENILQKDEEIIWSESINKSAYIIKNMLIYALIFTFIGLFLSFFIGGPVSGIIAAKGNIDPDSTLINIGKIIWIIVFGCGVFFSFIGVCLTANKTYFAITNKRIIKRSGVFNINYIHYSLKNIGTVRVAGSLFDKKGKNPSASLYITVKDYHTNTDGNTSRVVLPIQSLNNAYEAYKKISDLTDGNNENLRVKLEK